MAEVITMTKQIIMYSFELCGDCQNLKAFMAKHGIPYANRDIKKNPAYAQELREKTGKEGVPYLIIDGEWVRGYEVGKPFCPKHRRQLNHSAKAERGRL